MDQFSRKCAAYPLKSKNTEDVQEALNKLMDENKFLVLQTVSFLNVLLLLLLPYVRH